MFIFTGCIELTKTPITSEIFKSSMEGMNYSIVDVTDQFDSNFAKKIYLATKWH